MKKKSKKNKKRNMKQQMKLPQLHNPLKALKAISREVTKAFNTTTRVHEDKKKYSRKRKHKKNFLHDDE